MTGCDDDSEDNCRSNEWGDRDRSRRCLKCHAVGLRYDAKTQFCGTCYGKFSGLVKANWAAFDLETVVRRYSAAMVDAFGKEQAAALMQTESPLVLTQGASADDYALDRVIHRYKAEMVKAHGFDEAAKLLRLNPHGLRADLERYKGQS